MMLVKLICIYYALGIIAALVILYIVRADHRRNVQEREGNFPLCDTCNHIKTIFVDTWGRKHYSCIYFAGYPHLEKDCPLYCRFYEKRNTDYGD